MKKKGRVSGTIGWLLAVILCLGVIGYSTYLGVSGFMGAATGNAIVARFNDAEKQAGEANTKQLVKDATTGVSGKTEGLTYTSYTMTYQTSMYAEVEGNKVSSTATGIFYVNNDYTYVKVSSEGVENKEFKTSKTEYVFVKATGKTYVCTNSVAQNVEDSLLLDTAVWTETTSSVDAAQIFALFAPLTADGAVIEFDVISGEYKMEATAETVTTAYGFTVGYRPNLYAKVYSADEKNVTTCALTFSNVNNTKVSIPKSLQDEMNKQEVAA